MAEKRPIKLQIKTRFTKSLNRFENKWRLSRSMQAKSCSLNCAALEGQKSVLDSDKTTKHQKHARQTTVKQTMRPFMRLSDKKEKSTKNTSKTYSTFIKL